MALSYPPPLSSLQTLLTQPPLTSSTSTPSPLASLPSALPNPHQDPYIHLTKQILYSLTHEFKWTELQTHTHSPDTQTPTRLPRPLISGLPPTRLYVHPDEQVEHLAALKAAELREQRSKPSRVSLTSRSRYSDGPEDSDSTKPSTKPLTGLRPIGSDGKSHPSSLPTVPEDPAHAPTDSAEGAAAPVSTSAETAPAELTVEELTREYERPEREWVLPTHIRESVSLREIAAVFDAIPTEPPLPPPLTGPSRSSPERSLKVVGDLQIESKQAEEGQGWMREGRKGRKRSKRVVLAIVSDDSTVVYYIVHEGVVKPRQN